MQKLGQIDSELSALNRELNALLTVGPRDALQCGCEDLAGVIGRLNALKAEKLKLFDKQFGSLPYPSTISELTKFRTCCQNWQSGWLKLVGNGSALIWSSAFGHWVAYIREIETQLNSGFNAILKKDIVCEKLYQIYISKMTVFHTL
jgi:hypothetical protein